MKKNYTRTIYACFIAYMVQAIVNNFTPLLFVTFQETYHISLSRITVLVTVNFCIQLLIDLVSAHIVARLGYRAAMLFSQILCTAGLASLAVFPEWMPNAFCGLLLSTAIYAAGGGLAEVLISPIVEASPTDNKEKAMSLLHSFYCWGQVAVILLSTVFFAVFGVSNWRLLALLWSIVPFVNIFIFAGAPINTLETEGENTHTLKKLFSNRIFWLFMIMMMCAGASELTISQWASAFAEQGLGVSKTIGDLAGPLSFAALMGCTRLYYGKSRHQNHMQRFMMASCVLCVVSYLCMAVSPVPLCSFLGFALCGASVAIFWPGIYSMAANTLNGGSTLMFAWLALAGDFGCAAGPAVAGFVSDIFSGNLKVGILASLMFPVILGICLVVLKRKRM